MATSGAATGTDSHWALAGLLFFLRSFFSPSTGVNNLPSGHRLAHSSFRRIHRPKRVHVCLCVRACVVYVKPPLVLLQQRLAQFQLQSAMHVPNPACVIFVLLFHLLLFFFLPSVLLHYFSALLQHFQPQAPAWD